MKRGLLLALILVLSAVALAAPTNLALNKEYVFNIGAHANYPDSGNKLTDGKYARAVGYGDPDFFAVLREDYRIVVIDLEAVYKIDKVLCNFLNQYDAGCYRPSQIALSLSEDGRRWRSADYQEVYEDELPKTGTYLHRYELDGGGMKARYVAVKFNCEIWVFIDEFEVIGDPDTKQESTAKISIYDIDFEDIDFEF